MTRAEILDCLTDRPCDSCKFHESGRCERWDCVFEEKPDDCEDTISRQAVLDTLDATDKFMDEERTVETYKVLLKECYEVLPSVTPKQKMGRWIPVSERLPEKGVECLVFVKGYDECAYYEDDMVLMPDNRLHESGYCKHGECEKCEHAPEVIYTDFQVCSYWGKDEATNLCHNGWAVIDEQEEVIAWMPLPEPYKAESEDKK